MRININAFGDCPDREENRSCIKDADFLGHIDDLLETTPTDAQLEDVRKTLFGTNKAWVPRYLLHDLTSDEYPFVPPLPKESDHYIFSYELNKKQDVVIIETIGDEFVWTPLKVVIDDVEQEIKSTYTMSVGRHVVEVWDDPESEGYTTTRNFVYSINTWDYINPDLDGIMSGFVIPNYIEHIGENSFSGLGLTSITIPDSVTSIGISAFQICIGLTGVTLQAITPPSLGDSAFDNTNNCPIYVPGESVETYKSASKWSSLADRIFAIPD